MIKINIIKTILISKIIKVTLTRINKSAGLVK